MNVAYFFSTFPQLSTTFLQREVRALRSLGLELLLVANRSPVEGEYHPSDSDLLSQTFYLAAVNPMIYFAVNFKKVLSSPLRYFKGIIYAVQLRDADFPNLFFKNIMRFFGAVVLADYLEKKKISHVHVHFAFGAAGVAIFFKIISGITYSLSIHGSDVLLPQPLTSEKLKQASFIISNCRFHIQNLINRYPFLCNQRFYPVYLGIDTSSEIWSNRSIPKRDNGALRILNVAMLKPVKGHHILLKACALLKEKKVEVECRIVGEGPERNRLELLIDQLGLHSSVKLLGACYEEEVSAHFEWAQVVVLSSYSEGTPMVIIEAMMKGRPVVAPRITAIPEMIIEGKNGWLFDKANPVDLAEKIEFFENSPESIVYMGKNGRRHAETLFDLTLNAKKIISVFQENI